MSTSAAMEVAPIGRMLFMQTRSQLLGYLRRSLRELQVLLPPAENEE